MPSELQSEVLAALYAIMRPIARLLLRCGIGVREFSRVSKSAFVDIATEEYGIRGRPTNISRVAVMTGLTRKEVKLLRDRSRRTTDLWGGKLNPPTEILHFWHNDKEFCDALGRPRALKFAEGNPSFTDLVRRYAGDIPAGAMKVELLRSGAMVEDGEGLFIPVKSHYVPMELDREFIRSISFSLSNLAATIAHNAKVKSAQNTHENGEGSLLLEQYVWTSQLTEADEIRFRQLADVKARELAEELDEWIGRRELTVLDPDENVKPIRSPNGGVGMGFYLFENS